MRIVVVGAGVIGLSSAIRLQQAGFHTLVYAKNRAPDITSSRAGAVFSPFRIDGSDRAEAWTRGAYSALCRLAEGPDGGSTGVTLCRMREFFHTPQPHTPWWAGLVRDFRSLDPPAPYAAAVSAVIPRMDMRRYMPWLESRYRELGGRIVERHVERLEDCFDAETQCVVNCAGLGARQLAGDTTVVAVRGQVLHVANDIGMDEAIMEEARGAKTTYAFPFPEYIVLGGTYELDVWAEQTDGATLDAIVQRCRAMLAAAGVPGAHDVGRRVLRELAGLRPARLAGAAMEAVRLERERIGDRLVIHNYGHGRAGVTLAWGCAEAVVGEVASGSTLG
jgi:D-amino-acid oxidase